MVNVGPRARATHLDCALGSEPVQTQCETRVGSMCGRARAPHIDFALNREPVQNQCEARVGSMRGRAGAFRIDSTWNREPVQKSMLIPCAINVGLCAQI